MPKRTRVRTLPDGGQEVTVEEVAETPKAKNAKADETEQLSPALKLLRDLGGEPGTPDFVPYDLAGQKVFIARLSAPEMQMVSALSSRDAPGALNIASTDEVTAFVRAVLFVCVRCNEAGANFFSSLPEAWQFASARGNAARTVSGLFDACCLANPLLIAPPDSQTQEDEDDEKKE